MRQHLTLPNQLTILRLLLVPVVLWLAVAGFRWHYQVSAGVFAVASITDNIDGRIARSRNQITELGKFLDPLADKLLVISAALTLAGLGLIPTWVVIIIVARELLITGLRTVAAAQGVFVGSTFWARAKTFTQDMMIGLVMLAEPWSWIKPIAIGAVVLTVVTTVGSGLDYLWRYRRLVI